MLLATEFFQVHSVGIICGSRHILKNLVWNLFSISWDGSSAEEKNNPYLEKIMGISIPGSSPYDKGVPLNITMLREIRVKTHVPSLEYGIPQECSIPWIRRTTNLEEVWM